MDEDELDRMTEGGVGGAAVESEDLDPLRRWAGGVEAPEESEDDADASWVDRRLAPIV